MSSSSTLAAASGSPSLAHRVLGWLRPRWPYAVVLGAVLILFAPFLLGQGVLYFGTPLLQFYPWRWLALQELRAGYLPLWNPYLGNGAPLLANYQSALLYPPNWLSLLLPLDYSFSWLVVLHLVWAGWGMIALTRALGFRPLGQVIAGLSYGLSQYLVSRSGFFSINAVVAWVPWLILCVERATSADMPRRARLKYLLLLALCVALQLLAGHAQITWYTLLLAGAWSLWRLLTRGSVPPRTRLGVAVGLAAAVIVGFGLAAAQLLPTAELMRESSRADAAEYEFATTYSFSPWRLLTLLAPDFLGNPARGEYLGYGNYWEDAIYGGVLPLLLAGWVAVSALAALRRRPRALADWALPFFLLALMLVALALALGKNTPIFPFFYHSIPTFNLFQAPTRIMIWFVFGLALLAGLGADRLGSPQGRPRHRVRLGMTGALSMLFVGVAFYFITPATAEYATELHTIAAAIALAGLGLFLSGALVLLRQYLPASLWTPLVVAFVAIDLIYANAGLNPAAPPDLYTRATPSLVALQTAAGAGRLYHYPTDEYRIKFEHFLSFKHFGAPELAYATRAAALPNIALVDGLASAGNFEPLLGARYVALMQVISDTHALNLLRLMNVSVLASLEPQPFTPILAGAPGALSFYAVPGSLGRAWGLASPRVVVVADAAAALAAIADPAFDPATTLILESPAPSSAGPGDAPVAQPAAVTDSIDSLSASVMLPTAGYLVLADTHYPGWRAEVDGQPADLLRADYAFSAVAVPAGAHTITFRYQPQSFTVGVWVTVASAALWLVVALARLVTGRRR